MKAYVFEILDSAKYESKTAIRNKRLVFINQDKVRNIIYDFDNQELLVKLDARDERGENDYLYRDVKDPISFLKKITVEI